MARKNRKKHAGGDCNVIPGKEDSSQRYPARNRKSVDKTSPSKKPKRKYSRKKHDIWDSPHVAVVRPEKLDIDVNNVQDVVPMSEFGSTGISTPKPPVQVETISSSSPVDMKANLEDCKVLLEKIEPPNVKSSPKEDNAQSSEKKIKGTLSNDNVETDIKNKRRSAGTMDKPKPPLAPIFLKCIKRGQQSKHRSSKNDSKSAKENNDTGCKAQTEISVQTNPYTITQKKDNESSSSLQRQVGGMDSCEQQQVKPKRRCKRKGKSKSDRNGISKREKCSSPSAKSAHLAKNSPKKLHLDTSDSMMECERKVTKSSLSGTTVTARDEIKGNAEDKAVRDNSETKSESQGLYMAPKKLEESKIICDSGAELNDDPNPHKDGSKLKRRRKSTKCRKTDPSVNQRMMTVKDEIDTERPAIQRPNMPTSVYIPDIDMADPEVVPSTNPGKPSRPHLKKGRRRRKCKQSFDAVREDSSDEDLIQTGVEWKPDGPVAESDVEPHANPVKAPQPSPMKRGRKRKRKQSFDAVKEDSDEDVIQTAVDTRRCSKRRRTVQRCNYKDFFDSDNDEPMSNSDVDDEWRAPKENADSEDSDLEIVDYDEIEDYDNTKDGPSPTKSDVSKGRRAGRPPKRTSKSKVNEPESDYQAINNQRHQSVLNGANPAGAIGYHQQPVNAYGGTVYFMPDLHSAADMLKNLNVLPAQIVCKTCGRLFGTDHCYQQHLREVARQIIKHPQDSFHYIEEESEGGSFVQVTSPFIQILDDTGTCKQEAKKTRTNMTDDSKVRCILCKSKFGSLEEGLVHIGRNHCHSCPYMYCTECGVVLVNHKAYIAHTMKYHPESAADPQRKVPCSCCTMHFESNTQLVDHFTTSHPDAFLYLSCDKRFVTKAECLHHQPCSKSGKGCHCPVCGVALTTAAAMKDHVISTHSSFLPLNEPLNEKVMYEIRCLSFGCFIENLPRKTDDQKKVIAVNPVSNPGSETAINNKKQSDILFNRGIIPEPKIKIKRQNDCFVFHPDQLIHAKEFANMEAVICDVCGRMFANIVEFRKHHARQKQGLIQHPQDAFHFILDEDRQFLSSPVVQELKSKYPSWKTALEILDPTGFAAKALQKREQKVGNSASVEESPSPVPEEETTKIPENNANRKDKLVNPGKENEASSPDKGDKKGKEVQCSPAAKGMAQGIQCMLCAKNFQSLKDGLVHIGRYHCFQSPYMYCGDCGVVLMDQESYIKHTETFHPENMKNAATINPCHCCPSEFDKEDKYKNHLDEAHGNPFQCPKCDESFLSFAKLAQHRGTHEEGGYEFHPCPICGHLPSSHIDYHIKDVHADCIASAIKKE